MEFVAGLLAIVVLIFIYDKNKRNKGNNKPIISPNTESTISINNDAENLELIPYRKQYLLTKNELYFYKGLKNIAKEYGYVVCAKVRLADLVEVNKEAPEKEYLKYFSKIASKHIDFILCNPENLYVEYLIELDDNSHNESNRIERDKFVEKVTKKCGYTLLRVRSIEQVKNSIINKNNISL